MTKIKLTKKNEGAKRTHLGRCKNCGKGWRQTFYLDELAPDVKAYLKEKGYADNADICPDCINAVKAYLAKGEAKKEISLGAIMGIKLIKKTNEAVHTAVKNPDQAAFIIDCGSPEKAKELNDAFGKAAYDDTGSELTSRNLGGDPVQWWNVGQFFTACVDPCDKAAAWCEEWLRNSGNAAPAIQGNSAGLESNGDEALSPKMQQRLKINAWQDATMKMKGFDEAGHTFLDMINPDGTFNSTFLPIEPAHTEKEGLANAKKIFGDFEDYIDFGADKDEDDAEVIWLPYYGLKKEFLDLSKEDGLAVLKEFDNVLYKAFTKGIKAFK